LRVDLFEKIKKLGSSVALVAFADHKSDATSRAAKSDVVPWRT
jgi:hypothetical protein